MSVFSWTHTIYYDNILCVNYTCRDKYIQKCPYFLTELRLKDCFKKKKSRRVQLRWQGEKTLSSPLPIGIPRQQLFAEKKIQKKFGTHQKRSSTTNDIKKESKQD